MSLWIQETYVNATEDVIFGEGPIVETLDDTPGELFRTLQGEYGRCISKIYVDRADAPPRVIGWVFQSRQRYEDSRSGETYLREVWVAVHSAEPTRTVQYHYAELGDE